MKISSEPINSFWKDLTIQTIVGIIVTLFVSTGLIVYAWSGITSFFSDLHGSVSEPIILPRYGPYLSYLIGVVSLFIFIRLRDYFKRDYTTYNKDKFKGIIWKWRYNYKKEVIESSITPICPKCNSIMRMYSADDHETGFLCKNEGCEFSDFKYAPIVSGSPKRNLNQLSASVDRNLRNLKLKL